MRRFLLSVLLFTPYALWANEPPVAKGLSDDLTQDANVVKRSEQIVFEILNMKETVLKKKVSYVILNEKGNDYAKLVVGYDKLRKVTSLDGTLYDARGNVLRKAKNKDIEDYSSIQEISLFEDNRVKVLDLTFQTFPYTVEFEVELKYNNTYMIPDWFPQQGEHLSVESSTFTFIAPIDYTIRYKAFNYKGEPQKTQQKNRQMQTWQVTKIPAVKRSYASPTWNELTPCVYFAPSQFEFEGYKGNGSTWEELGKFQIELNKGRDVLPPGDVQKVKNIISGIDSEQEKVKLLYEYLQKNTRYISIQLGIGGLQPFEAGFVAQKGYGDCKALSNYMYSLLKAAGIRSYYTWVRAGEGPDDHYLIEDFPSDQFNHIILCVPLSKDTLWLECTNQDVPAGYMGRFTGNRKALLITEEGGKLVSTPRYALKENFQLRTVTATLSADGNLEMNVETKYGGIQQDQLTMMIHSLSREKVQRMLQEGFQLSTYHVNDFKYDAIKAVLPQLNEHLSISVSGYATVSGKRLFITPNVLNRSAHHMEAEEDRQFEFVFGEEWRDEDHYEIVLPDGYEPEALPRDVAIRTKFGSYTSQTSVAGNKIVYHRVREQYAGHFPAADQTLLAGFLNEIHKADRSRIVMVKKGG